MTVDTLQSRLSELQVFWQTTKRRESALSANVETDAGSTANVEGERPVLMTGAPGLLPTKSVSPLLRSPLPRHIFVPSIEAVLMSHSGTDSLESISPIIMPAPPQTPPASSTSTPRARQLAALQASLTSSPERAAVELFTLPPLSTHESAALACPRCSTKVPSVASRFYARCGMPLSGG